MKCLKIAMVTGLFPTVSETFVVNQILALQQAGQKVDVFCFKKNDDALLSTLQQVTNVKVLNWRNFMPHSYAKRLLKITAVLLQSMSKRGVFLKLLKALFYDKKINTHYFFKTYYNLFFKLKNYDVAHVHFGTNAVRLLPQLKQFDKKVVVTFHGFDIHKYDSDFYSELIETDSAIFTTNSEFAKHELLKIGFLEPKVFVLPDGIDTNLFKPNKKVHSSFNVLFVGRLIELKAPILAIKIVEKVIKKGIKNVCLTIVGDGEEFNNCNNYIEEKKLRQYITLAGKKTQEEVVEYMNNSDVFLFPGIVDANGRCETQGLVLREAQAMELPVVISDVGGMHEGVIDKETGFVLKANDLDAFTHCLVELINNPEKRKRMGEEGREYIVNHYDNTVLVKTLLEIYLK